MQMTGNDIASIITAVSLVITAASSLVAAISSLRNSGKIERARREMNGLKTELVQSTRELGRHEGRVAQRADDKEEAER